MIILDFNGISIASIIVNKVDLEENLVRHMILNSIRMYRSKFKDKYGEIVIAADAPYTWRREYYPEYKANRRKGRSNDTMDWNEAFRILNKVREELKEFFPYKVLQIEGCEADDIIGTLVENTHEFGNYENVMIVSSDKDFVQLQKYDNVQQFSPMKKALINEPNPKLFLLEHILRGDASDGVPNVLSDNDVLVNEDKRQTPLSKKKLSEIITDITSEHVPTYASWYSNYCRNKKLIDLSETPEDIKKDIINKFNEQEQNLNKGKVFPYMVEKQLGQLLQSVQEFI
jgi:5'-3' exonuclease